MERNGPRMKSFVTAVVFFTLLCTNVSSVSAQQGFVSLPVNAARSAPTRLVRRAGASGPFAAVIQNQDTFYSIDVSLGTPPQQVSVILDTGSSELWVDPDCNSAPYAEQQQCLRAGSYDPKKSSTPPYGPFSQNTINYGDSSDTSTQTSASIVYYSDTLAISGLSVTNQTFGVVWQSQGIAQGIMGLGPDPIKGFTPGDPYSFVLDSLAAQKVIASRVFSLDLRSSTSQSGALIFGGLDRAMYAGSLLAAPLVKGLYDDFRLAADITSVAIALSSSSSPTSISVGSSAAQRACLLDSGSTLTRLNPVLAAQIVTALQGVPDASGFSAVPCSLMESTASISFTFDGGAVVTVPMTDFVLNRSDNTGADVCYIAMAETTELQVLGDSVLRAGYFVFDWDNEMVHIGQAATCDSSNIVAASSGTNAVPSVTGLCGSVLGPQPTVPPFVSSSFTTSVTITSCAASNPTCTIGVVTQTSVASSASTLTSSATSSNLPLAVGFLVFFGLTLFNLR